MKTDVVTKILLAIIALALSIQVLDSLTHPKQAKAAESFTCSGDLKNENSLYTAIEWHGGYTVDIHCR
jgi:hypothetical protein